MEIFLILIGVIIIIALSYTIFLLIGQNNPKTIEDKFARISSEALRINNDQFMMLARQVLGEQKNEIKTEIKTDLEGKKSAITDLIAEIRRDIHKHEEKLSRSEDERIRSFSALQNELKSYKEITGELKISTDRLKDILSNNQMRGAFGEQIADDLLKMAGFVVGLDYTRNEAQQTETTRPDFTILLPDQTKINIDVKFPYASLVKYIETDDKNQKDKYFKDFQQDVKNKIKQISTREYINPEEKTVDFVILFIPNEMIFSFIYDKMNNIWKEAMQKKVILAGPFSFTAILRMVKQAYTNFRYQENLQHIIGLIQKFDSEYQKFTTELDKVGERISSAGKQFDLVSNTRHRQLSSIMDKIKNRNILEKNEINLLSSDNDNPETK
ncbi:MAG: DNA recombination protein RmuC [bacterium]